MQQSGSLQAQPNGRSRADRPPALDQTTVYIRSGYGQGGGGGGTRVRAEVALSASVCALPRADCASLSAFLSALELRSEEACATVVSVSDDAPLFGGHVICTGKAVPCARSSTGWIEVQHECEVTLLSMTRMLTAY